MNNFSKHLYEVIDKLDSFILKEGFQGRDINMSDEEIIDVAKSVIPDEISMDIKSRKLNTAEDIIDQYKNNRDFLGICVEIAQVKVGEDGYWTGLRDELDNYIKSNKSLSQSIHQLIMDYVNEYIKDPSNKLKSPIEIKASSKEEGITIGYRTIGIAELKHLLDGDTINGRYSNSSEKQNKSSLENVVCFFTTPLMWDDKDHLVMIKCKFDDKDVLEVGQGDYYAASNLRKTNIWSGKRGNTKYKIEEFYTKSYNIQNVVAFVDKYLDVTIENKLEDGVEHFLKIYDHGDKEKYIEKYRALNIPVIQESQEY